MLFGIFRSEEVLSIKRSHITFHDDYMTIKVEKSKTDQLSQGDEVIIAQTDGSACPVSILLDYLSRLNIDPSSFGRVDFQTVGQNQVIL